MAAEKLLTGIFHLIDFLGKKKEHLQTYCIPFFSILPVRHLVTVMLLDGIPV